MRLALRGILLVLAVLCLSSYALDVIQADVKLEPSSVALESNIEAIPVNEVQFHVGGFKLKEVPSNKRGDMLDLQNAEVETEISVDSIAAPITSFEGMDINKHFVPIEVLEKYQSLEIIQNLPVSTYFDVIKGDFRFGVLGEHIMDLYPQLLSFIDRRVVTKGKTHEVEKLPVVNVPTTFMYTLGAIKDMHAKMLRWKSRSRRFKRVPHLCAGG